MSKTIKQFGYHVVKMEPGDRLSASPYVKIVLDNWSTVGDGVPSITPQLMHEDEVDTYIRLLKADLDAIGKQAKSALRKAKEAAAARQNQNKN